MARSFPLQHPASGVRRTGYEGFSWTSLFFGGLPALIRGDIAYGLGIIVAQILLGLVSFGLLSIAVAVIWAAVYNKHTPIGYCSKGSGRRR